MANDDPRTAADKKSMLLSVVKNMGMLRRDKPIELASGFESRYFVDTKKALAAGADLKLACEVLHNEIAATGLVYEAIGGLTLGADPIAHAYSVLFDCNWFTVRKEPKSRGTRRQIEGVGVAGLDVVIVDDVVTTGDSIQKSFDAVREAGGRVVLAITLLDRSGLIGDFFRDQGTEYVPLFDYDDLEIPRVGSEGLLAS